MVSVEDAAEGTADATEDAATNTGALGGATEDTEEAAKGALASFDEINVLAQDTASDSGGGGGGGGGAAIVETPTLPTEDEPGDTFLDELADDVEAFKERMLIALQPTIDAIERLKVALEPLKDFVLTGLTDFYTNFLEPVGVWVLGEGLPRFIDGITFMAENIDWTKINDSLAGFWDSLAPFAINVGEGLLWFWENILVPLGTWVMSDAVPAFLDLLSAALDVLTATLDALEPLGDWLYTTFLVPIAEWAGDTFIDLIGLLTDALTGLSDWITNNQLAVQEITKALFAFFLVWKIDQLLTLIGPFVANLWAMASAFLSLTVSLLANTVAKMANKLETIAIAALYAGDFLKNLLSSALRIAEETIAWLASTIAKVAAEIAQIALNIAVGVWNVVGAIAAGVTTAFGAAMTFLTSPIGLVILAILAIIAIIYLLIKYWPQISEAAKVAWEWIKATWEVVANWFNESVIKPVAEWFEGAWEDITGWFTGAWETIQGAWSSVATWFQESVIDPIAEGWDTFISWLTTAWTTLWTGVGDIVKTAINLVIGFINGLIRGVVAGINAVIEALNSISIDIPDWVPGFGGETWGINLATISAPQIPLLARGAVIPPNSRFAAILGDQRNGRNLEAPESLIRQIIQEEMGAIETDVKIEFGGTLGALVRELSPIISKETTRIGRSMVRSTA